jgi:hypothetical protein
MPHPPGVEVSGNLAGAIDELRKLAPSGESWRTKLTETADIPNIDRQTARRGLITDRTGRAATDASASKSLHASYLSAARRGHSAPLGESVAWTAWGRLAA